MARRNLAGETAHRLRSGEGSAGGVAVPPRLGLRRKRTHLGPSSETVLLPVAQPVALAFISQTAPDTLDSNQYFAAQRRWRSKTPPSPVQ